MTIRPAILSDIPAMQEIFAATAASSIAGPEMSVSRINIPNRATLPIGENNEKISILSGRMQVWRGFCRCNGVFDFYGTTYFGVT